MLHVDNGYVFFRFFRGLKEFLFTLQIEKWALLVLFGMYLVSEHPFRGFWVSANFHMIHSYTIHRLDTSTRHYMMYEDVSGGAETCI